MEVNFVQFYEDTEEILLRNSYSSIWNYLDNIIWVETTKLNFPDINGTAYVSCSFEHEIDFLNSWAKARPDINFIVGGPAIIYGMFNTILPNIQIENKQLYELLNVKPNIESWDLKIPTLNPSKRIYYNYSLAFGNKCYWGKCTFCNSEDKNPLDLEVSNIPILKPGNNRVWLNKQALTGNDILRIFPNLSEESIYSMYLRGDQYVLNALDKVPIVKTIRPIIGIEFPSNKMLRIMNKGTDIETIYKVIMKFLENDCHVILTTIHGWPELNSEDLFEAYNFLNKLDKYKHKINCIDHLLISYKYSPNTIKGITKFGKNYYINNLSKEQQDLNNAIRRMYREFGFSSYTDNNDDKIRGTRNL